MLNLRPYFCPKCGHSYYHGECLKSEYKLYCRHCSSKKICLNGLVLIMVAATLAVAFTIPYIVYSRFNYDVLKYSVVFLPAIFGIAVVGILRMIQQRRIKSTKPLDENTEVAESQTPTTPADDQPGEDTAPLT